jgi:hypothetical protein
MSATTERPRLRSNADLRADEIVAAYERCADAAAVYRTIDRARRSVDEMRQLADQAPYRRVDAARAAAFQKHVPPPEPTP